MSYTNDTKPTTSYSNDTKPTSELSYLLWETGSYLIFDTDVKCIIQQTNLYTNDVKPS